MAEMRDREKGKHHRGGAERRLWSLRSCPLQRYSDYANILSAPLKNGGRLFSYLAEAGLLWPLTHVATMALTDALSEVASARLIL